MSKRKKLINSYESFKANSFYGVGQRKAKLFMNGMLKKLDAQIDDTPDDTQFQYRRNALYFYVVFLSARTAISTLRSISIPMASRIKTTTIT